MRGWFSQHITSPIKYSLLSQNGDELIVDNSDPTEIVINNSENENDEFVTYTKGGSTDIDKSDRRRNNKFSGNKLKRDFKIFYTELVGSKKRLNYKKVALITGFALLVVILIVVGVVLLSDDVEAKNGTIDYESLSQVSTHEPSTASHTITLEDILEGRLTARRFNGSWLSSNEILYRDLDGFLLVYDIETKKITTLLDNEYETLLEAFNFEMSADRKFLLIAREHAKLFRHSYNAKYSIMNLETKTVSPLYIRDAGTDQLTLVEWSPVGNGLVIVFERNIYFKSDVSATAVQITFDTDFKVNNGIPDWVYEEEVFTSNSALRFSPDGKRLAFVRFDDTPTNLVGYSYYGVPGTQQSQYPSNVVIPYPKSGSPNPTVNAYEVSLENLVLGTRPQLAELKVPTKLANQEHILTTLSWATNDTVVATWMNRVQNNALIQVCSKGECHVIRDVKSENGWIELFSAPIYNKAGTELVLIFSQNQENNAGGYRHLTQIAVDNGVQVALTRGKYVVQEILHWDLDLNYIFYTANTAKDSKVLHVFGVKAKPNATAECLTCDLKYPDASINHGNKGKQTYFEATFSTKGKSFVLSSLGPNIPRVDIFTYKLQDDKIVVNYEYEWETNPELHEITSDKITPITEYDEIPLASGFTANVMMVLPRNIDRSGRTKYPMLVDVYGGPDSYGVTYKWSMDWGNYLTAAKHIIYAKIDGRGSGLRGDKLLHQIYRAIGTVEIEDQIETSRKLGDKYPFIDRRHVAIWGWSYGGYASAMALARDTQAVFKCAASVAPVTDWTYYDSIYTERFMGLPTPDDNLKGYDNSRLSTLYNEFRNKNFFLIHGTLDDNVHFQQSMALSRTLERNDVLFKQMSYSDEDHSLAGVRPHLYHTLGNFFSDCFDIRNSSVPHNY